METIKTGVVYRTAEIRAVDDERRVELAFSSEEPVERSFGIEILDHGANSVDMEFMGSGRAPLLVDHNPADQVGVVETASLGTDRVARADVRFGKSERASEMYEDVKDGIRTNISVGYRINKMEVEDDEEGGTLTE